jgi:hypothetical protein
MKLMNMWGEDLGFCWRRPATTGLMRRMIQERRGWPAQVLDSLPEEHVHHLFFMAFIFERMNHRWN